VRYWILCLSSPIKGHARSRQCDSITFYKQERDTRFGILFLREENERRDLIDQSTGLFLWPFKVWPMVVDVS